jgi:hypothetical protein
MGLLPPGVHTSTLEEAREQFATFQGSDRRIQLLSRLARFVNELRRSGRFSAIVIDGSFVTSKPAPEDIDIIVTLRPDHDWSTELSAMDYALVTRREIRRRFGFDALLAIEYGRDYERYVEFFGRVREDTAVRKGMLRIEL